METTPTKFQTVEEYFATLPEDQKSRLEELKSVIKEAAPEAKEVISYNMPAFRQHGILVYCAAYKEHIGFYPTAKPIEVFADRLANYKTSKGAIQFPIEEPIPVDLVKDIVKFRLQEDVEKAKAKKKK